MASTGSLSSERAPGVAPCRSPAPRAPGGRGGSWRGTPPPPRSSRPAATSTTRASPPSGRRAPTYCGAAPSCSECAALSPCLWCRSSRSCVPRTGGRAVCEANASVGDGVRSRVLRAGLGPPALRRLRARPLRRRVHAVRRRDRRKSASTASAATAPAWCAPTPSGRAGRASCGCARGARTRCSGWGGGGGVDGAHGWAVGGAGGSTARGASTTARTTGGGPLSGANRASSYTAATRLLVLTTREAGGNAFAPGSSSREPATGRTHQTRVALRARACRWRETSSMEGGGAAEAATRTRTRTRTVPTRGGPAARGEDRAPTPSGGTAVVVAPPPAWWPDRPPRRTLGRGRAEGRGEGGRIGQVEELRAGGGGGAATTPRALVGGVAHISRRAGSVASTSVPRARRHDAPIRRLLRRAARLRFLRPVRRSLPLPAASKAAFCFATSTAAACILTISSKLT